MRRPYLLPASVQATIVSDASTLSVSVLLSFASLTHLLHLHIMRSCWFMQHQVYIACTYHISIHQTSFPYAHVCALCASDCPTHSVRKQAIQHNHISSAFSGQQDQPLLFLRCTLFDCTLLCNSIPLPWASSWGVYPLGAAPGSIRRSLYRKTEVVLRDLSWRLANPGLMQSHNGVGYTDQASILQMIQDGTCGTYCKAGGGDGLMQTIQKFGIWGGLRAYNLGDLSVDLDNLGSAKAGTLSYVSDIANRLVGAKIAH